ncbi:MAG: hypothetical protein IPP15_00740 [Saprospiraceae bacterium]|uniref:Phytanoyl-CoA dioxygenase n=1 Tax=Candidatus Opimibacter skivensis TaxID=2982028 RepID=A0A9D7SS20_9BACT|nr:hypothetical protein [Candidatus Opimibacter skivensis]
MLSLSHLQSITDRILDADDTAYGKLYAACDELYETLIKASRIDPREEKNKENQSLDSGAALGITWAAMCIKDIMRTKRFMNGVYAAVRDILLVHPEKTIHILYAGTGPFATLVLPLTARFSPEQIQLTLLEVNETSFNSLQNLVSILHLEKYIHRLEKADATKWKKPVNDQIDIFIVEAMQQGLKSEPHVAICMNIVPQLRPDTIMIPQQITLTAALLNEPKRMQEKFESGSIISSIHILDPVFILNKETILSRAESDAQRDVSDFTFQGKTIVIAADVVEDYPNLYLITDVLIYKEDCLLLDESPLSMPLKLADLRKELPTEIKFQYHIGSNPGIQFNMTML